jgi:hypothetical protein
MSTNLFNGSKSQTFVEEETPLEDNTNDEVDYVSLLKEAGKPTDAVALAKKAVHADRTIEAQKLRLQELEQELTKRLSYEDLRDTLVKANVAKPNNASKPIITDDEDEDHSRVEDDSKTKVTDIRKLVQDVINQEATKNSARQNVAQVVDTLKSTWGSNYEATLRLKAREIGVSEGFLETLAAEQPKALLRLVGIDIEPKKDNATFMAPPKSSPDVPRSPNGNNNPSGYKGYKYYEDMRKKDPKAYWTGRVQNELMRAASVLGDDFYKK